MSVAIKEKDLHALVDELVDDAIKIDRPNKEKICNYVINLVNNGGHKTKAARAAGYGGQYDENGKRRTDEERNRIAGAEGYRLLKNEQILSLYEKLAKQKFSAKIFCDSLDKQHLISRAYKEFERLKEEKPRTAHAFFQEVCKMKGFYVEQVNVDNAKLAEQQAEILEAVEAIKGAGLSPTKPESKPDRE